MLQAQGGCGWWLMAERGAGGDGDGCLQVPRGLLLWSCGEVSTLLCGGKGRRCTGAGVAARALWRVLLGAGSFAGLAHSEAFGGRATARCGVGVSVWSAR